MKKLLPTYIPLEEGLEDLKDHPNSQSYLHAFFETYVRDTPFTSGQIADLHDHLLETQGPEGFPFKTATIQRQLLRMRKSGEVIPLIQEDESPASDRIWIYAPAIHPDPENDADHEKRVEPFDGPNPFTAFFERVLRSLT